MNRRSGSRFSFPRSGGGRGNGLHKTHFHLCLCNKSTNRCVFFKPASLQAFNQIWRDQPNVTLHATFSRVLHVASFVPSPRAMGTGGDTQQLHLPVPLVVLVETTMSDIEEDLFVQFLVYRRWSELQHVARQVHRSSTRVTSMSGFTSPLYQHPVTLSSHDEPKSRAPLSPSMAIQQQDQEILLKVIYTLFPSGPRGPCPSTGC